MQSFDIAQEQSNGLVTGGVWTICLWPGQEGEWYSQVQFAPEGQAGTVAFAPLGPFPTAEIALLEGEAEFHQQHYKAYMTLLLRLPVTSLEKENQDFIFNAEREVREIYRSTENRVGAYGLDGQALPA